MPEYLDPVKRIARDAEEWAEKQKLLQMSEISLVLDSYDDIFSDFDPRNYDHRALSDDFLAEMKRATRENKSGIIELHFLIPAEAKKTETENLVKKRLREHFKKHYDQIETDVKLVKRSGLTMVFIGLLVSVAGALFLHKLEGFPQSTGQLISGVLFFLAEPAAWFIIWDGFDRILNTWRELEPDLEFYRKMSKSEVTFTTY